MLFYNVEKSLPPLNEEDGNSTIDAKNVSVFLSLKSVSADSIKCIQNYGENDLNDLPEKYGHCETNPGCLNDAFWIAMKLLRNCGYKLNQSKILVLTDNPQPFERDSAEERNAFKKAEDLRDSEIIVTVVPMTDTFSGKPFYSNFLSIVCEDDSHNEFLEHPSQQREALVERVFQKDFRKRCNQRIKFHFGHGLDMSVGIYSMYRIAKPPKKVLLKTENDEVVQAKRVNVINVPDEIGDEDPSPSAPPPTTLNDMPMEVKKYQRIGEEKIAFTTNEFTQMKRVREPGLILLGFKPRSAFNETTHLNGPSFMFPDETILKGSTQLFVALWKKCIEMKKVAYGILIERINAHPKLVALVPQQEMQTERIQRYDGFRIEFIPYADCIREIEAFNEQLSCETTQEGVDLMKNLIKSLRFRYNPACFSNPVVQGRYDVIEASIFSKETAPETKDTTKPAVEIQDKKIEPLIEKFNEIFVQEEEEEATTTKRPLSSGVTRPAKVAKTFDLNDIQEAYNNNTLNSLTGDCLKAFLAKQNIKGLSKLKKQELVDMVQEIMEEREMAKLP